MLLNTVLVFNSTVSFPGQYVMPKNVYRSLHVIRRNVSVNSPNREAIHCPIYQRSERPNEKAYYYRYTYRDNKSVWNGKPINQPERKAHTFLGKQSDDSEGHCVAYRRKTKMHCFLLRQIKRETGQERLKRVHWHLTLTISALLFYVTCAIGHI